MCVVLGLISDALSVWRREYAGSSGSWTGEKTALWQNAFNSVGTASLLCTAGRHASVLHVNRRLQTYLELWIRRLVFVPQCIWSRWFCSGGLASV